MKRPNFMVSFPGGISEKRWAAIEAEIDILRAAPDNPISRARLIELGATITPIPYAPPQPVPALVRRAMALHR